LALALVGDEVHLAKHVADDEVDRAVAVPVAGEGRRGAADVDRLTALVLELLPRREAAVGFAAEEVDFARPRSGEDVAAPVAVEVHQLWSEADASAHGDAGDGAAGLEPGVGIEFRRMPRAGVAVDAQAALVVLADEEGRLAVAVDVADERSGVA